VLPLPEGPSQSGKQLVRRLVEEVWNQGDLKAVDGIFAAGFVNHTPVPGEAPGVSGLLDHVSRERAVFAGFRMVIEDLVAEGDRVVARLSWKGVHAGSRRGEQPTGQEASGWAINIFRVGEGRIVERWGLARSSIPTG